MARKSNFEQAAPSEQAAQEDLQIPKVKPHRDRFQKVFVLNAEQRRRLDGYCADVGITIQEVVIEGINLVLKSKGLPGL